MDREDLTAFLFGGRNNGYAILKQMGDTMTATLKDITANEADAVKTYDQLMKAETAEVEATQCRI